MTLVAKKTGGDYKPAPAGTHTAICFQVIDLGTQLTPFKDNSGNPKYAHQVRLGFELPNEPMEDGRPFTIGAFYTLSLHEKANLRHHLEAWRGRVFSEEELQGFHLKNILGKPCLLSVTHEMAQDGVKARVAGIMALPKGTQVPKQTNPSLMFDIDEWDQTTFDGLTDFFKKMICQSEEAKARGMKAPNGTGNGTAAASESSKKHRLPNGELIDETDERHPDYIPF